MVASGGFWIRFCASIKDDFYHCFFQILTEWPILTSIHPDPSRALSRSIITAHGFTFILYFCGSLLFSRTEITKPIKIIIEKLLHISLDFLSVSVRSWEHQIVSSININKCIKYKPGSNSNIQNKGDLWSYFKLKTFFILYFFLLMTIVQCKYLLKCK